MSVPGYLADSTKTVTDYEIDFSRLLTAFYGDLQSQIELADTKAQLIMGATAILLAALVSDTGNLSTILAVDGFFAWLSAALVLGTVVLLFGAISFAISATIPKIGKMRHADNLLFFGHIALLDEEEYQERFFALTANEIKRAYLTQIHARSRIVQRKFARVRWGMICLISAFLVWMIARIILSVIQ